ncbi:phage tail domain-containing protein [Siminovitchia terrae]|uniref:phage tail domain-containing protein n=1 Tax=Siminovitchia terrae TaxID=1914933 RepID=UPI0028B0C80D|nr:phage tail domain-containing protein [Siminovitchia terrae]
MTRFGITFDGNHSYRDYGLTVADKVIGNPSKIKVKERVPFSNEIYDFSGIYSGQEYEERLLTYVFNVKDYDKIDLSMKKVEVLNWVMRPNRKVKLIDDYIPGYYFMAEVEEDPDFDELRYHGRLTVNFIAYPFKIGELEEGNDLWDPFNFLLDYAQITEFDIRGSQNITLYNPGANTIKPTIRTTTPMQIIKDGKTFNVPVGESESYDFLLAGIENKLTVRGNGKISFHFQKELI